MMKMKEKTLDVVGTDGNPKKEEDAAAEASVPYYKLFSYADRYDMLMMLVGTISSIASGMGMPLLMIMLGQVIDSFGSPDKINAVNKVALKTLYLGVSIGIATFMRKWI
ncbi:hypothetical protein MKX01_033331 [Papaver californicum]|nr:hypothetical protein MKX01_033331 [Papaver californicum]